MTEQKTASYILRLALTLLIITAVVAGLLGYVNSITAGPIARAKEEKTQAALQAVVPQGVTIEGQVDDFTDETGMVEALYRTSDGYVVQVVTAGFGGDIELMVGVDGRGAVTGISIISHTETANLGAVAAGTTQTSVNWRGQFVGLSGELAVTKDGGQVEAISGATITSRAVTEGVNAALACAAAQG